jgi:hypothetical protein
LLYETQAKSIEVIKNHPFEYGLLTAIKDKKSYIDYEFGGYELHFTPPHVDDDTWRGDCYMDAGLSMRALTEGDPKTRAHFEYLELYFPDMDTTGNHYRVVCDERNEIIDHSHFYASINPDAIKTKTPLSKIDTFNQGLPTFISFKNGMFRNMEEFEDGNNKYVLLAHIRPSLNEWEAKKLDTSPKKEVTITYKILEQDTEGNIANAYVWDDTIEVADYDKRIAESEMGDIIGKGTNIPNNIIKSHIQNAHQALMGALNRGEK